MGKTFGEFSDDHIQKMREVRLGHKQSQETKLLKSKRLKGKSSTVMGTLVETLPTLLRLLLTHNPDLDIEGIQDIGSVEPCDGINAGFQM